MIMSEEIKNCPFCGAEAETNMILFDSKELISCSNRKCYAHYTGFTTTRKAWNNRPIEDSLRQEVERLREALKRIKEHGIPQSGASEKTWISCIMNIDSIARNALAPQIEGK
jgi:hypothetical protein